MQECNGKLRRPRQSCALGKDRLGISDSAKHATLRTELFSYRSSLASPAFASSLPFPQPLFAARSKHGTVPIQRCTPCRGHSAPSGRISMAQRLEQGQASHSRTQDILSLYCICISLQRHRQSGTFLCLFLSLQEKCMRSYKVRRQLRYIENVASAYNQSNRRDRQDILRRPFECASGWVFLVVTLASEVCQRAQEYISRGTWVNDYAWRSCATLVQTLEVLFLRIELCNFRFSLPML